MPNPEKNNIDKVLETANAQKEQNFDRINTAIKNNPENLEKLFKNQKELELLEIELKSNKDKATEMLYNTVHAITNKKGVKLQRDDKKSLEAIKAMIIDNKYATMDDLSIYQITTYVLKDSSSVEEYRKLFNSNAETNDRYKNISEKNNNTNIAALFIGSGKFANKEEYFFSAEQFTKELYTKNNERVKKITTILDGANFSVEDIFDISTMTTDTNDGKKLSDASLLLLKNEAALTSIKIKFPSITISADEYAYILEKNPTILAKRETEIVELLELENILKMETSKEEEDKKNAEILNELITDFTADKILEKYLAKNKNTKDNAYLYNISKYSTLSDIIIKLNTQIALVPSDTKISKLINFLKEGDLKEFQKSIYADVNFTSKLTNPYDNKIGPETLDILEQYVSQINTSKIGKDKAIEIETEINTDPAKETATEVPETTTTEKGKEINTDSAKETTTEVPETISKIKINLSNFNINQNTVNLHSGVKFSDYKDLFTAVSTKGTDTQIIAANKYMQAIMNGDKTINGANTDNQPGILTFKTICTTLGQTDIYTTVQARIDKAAADKAYQVNEKAKQEAADKTKEAKKIKEAANNKFEKITKIIKNYHSTFNNSTLLDRWIPYTDEDNITINVNIIDGLLIKKINNKLYSSFDKSTGEWKNIAEKNMYGEQNILYAKVLNFDMPINVFNNNGTNFNGSDNNQSILRQG